MHTRKTKIVCTLGPATEDENVLRELILSGMDVARFNFSHGTHATHKKALDSLKKLRTQLWRPIAAMLDTKGPEIRLCEFEGGKAVLESGSIFTLRAEGGRGNQNGVAITFPQLYKDVHPGTTVLIDDGLIELKVVEIRGQDIVCRVINGGTVSNSKGVNLPGTEISLPYLSEKDRMDIIFGIKEGFDFIAASFVRCADDILEIRRILDEYHCSTINIIAKIENRQGVENIDEILRVSDGIMVARGDMGVEIPLEEVPVIQKQLIKKVYKSGKQVITATQMLDSMMKNPRPTRAEATDVANAIFDGTSAIMLSGETAAGLYPVEALRTMVKIACRTEQEINYVKRFKSMEIEENPDVTNAISHATCTTAHDLGASAIVTVTKSGKTARRISKYRPNCPIIGCTIDENVCRQLNMSWGVIPLLVEEKNSTDELFDHAVDMAQNAGFLSRGEIVVITAGLPLGVSGTTNMMKVHVVGHVLITGQGVNKRTACAPLCVCSSEAQAEETFRDGDILVIPSTSNRILPLLKKASGIITEQPGLNTHAAVVGLSLDIPVITGADNATGILHSGVVVSIDSGSGIVSCKQ